MKSRNHFDELKAHLNIMYVARLRKNNHQRFMRCLLEGQSGLVGVDAESSAFGPPRPTLSFFLQLGSESLRRCNLSLSFLRHPAILSLLYLPLLVALYFPSHAPLLSLGVHLHRHLQMITDDEEDPSVRIISMMPGHPSIIQTKLATLH